ncbi:hypothetical protein GMDG_01227 [Pseudogymnoascus destructans 20631-21]|uniref:Protein kinase domain-containing protein n=1 Tax=Pseudogymnoascus destructans (strain ATCC MYA-4855 / 20631-21) TaxID=658429 RepID=L8FRQ7_PSED2|nr:hypothetical protein GMDG_01227 [Pseudogymnoascus destructans 20631-21]
MPLSPNQIIKGALASYRLLHPLKGSTIFKAEILPPPIISLSDVNPEGFNGQRLQSLPCRAPEVWMNQGVHHASDIWSLGVTLVHWLMESRSSEREISGLKVSQKYIALPN